MTPRWTIRPPGSNWGEFGPDDQCGRLNLITAEKVLQGIAEVKVGKVFCLSLPLDRPGGNYHNLQRKPPLLGPAVRSGRVIYNYGKGESYTDIFSDETVVLHPQFSTQWDGLAHVGSTFDADGDGLPEKRYYNGYRAGEDVVPPGPDGEGGALALGIANMATAGVQGRAVMIDLYGAFGHGRRYVGYDDLMRVCEADGVTVERGDMVCVHTGLAAALLAAGPNPGAQLLEESHPVLDGSDEALLRWIADSGLSVMAADNFAVEGIPARRVEPGKALEPLHELCLFKLGIHLGELWHLSELNGWLKANKRSRFLLTAPPLNLPRAIASPVTPLGTV